jgi:hypothetical protein
MSNPYDGLRDACFWARAMLDPAPGHIDPVTRAQVISPDEKVATIGSCFAQHLSKHIRSAGLTYHVAETAPHGMSDEESRRRNYGVFSARYGNVYTVRQALQLLERSLGTFVPNDGIWERDGGFVDAFRPQVEPDVYRSPSEVAKSAHDHLRYVRDVFTQCDWLVFTLGLTEGWRSKSDGAMYPLAPGVCGGTCDDARYEFVNFTVQEVCRDLELFVGRLSDVNPGIRVLLTVSPVPLIATYENRHVWVSTTVSKAVLRVAADEIERRFDNVLYFPAYEIVTNPAAGSRYFADDLRQVTPLGVSHVMRLFTTHFVQGSDRQPRVPPVRSHVEGPVDTSDDVVCDEEVIEQALRESGFARPVRQHAIHPEKANDASAGTPVTERRNPVN